MAKEAVPSNEPVNEPVKLPVLYEEVKLLNEAVVTNELVSTFVPDPVLTVKVNEEPSPLFSVITLPVIEPVIIALGVFDAVVAVPSKLPVKPYNAFIEPVNDTTLVFLLKVKSPLPLVAPASLNWIDWFGPAGAATAVTVNNEPVPS